MQADWYEMNFDVAGYECDVNGCMQPGAVLRRVQQISIDHCNALGLTAAEYARTQTAFLLARTSVEFYRPICEEETITLTTKPAAAQRAVFCRYTQLCDAAGEVLAAVDARWVLVSTESRRILRCPPSDLQLPFYATQVTQLDMKLNKPGEMHVAGQECATFTRCDKNRHLNNTRYADIVCDHIPLDEMATQPIKKLVVAYHKEVPMGESFMLRCGKNAQSSYYFVGESESGQHFEAEVTLQGNKNV